VCPILPAIEYSDGVLGETLIEVEMRKLGLPLIIVLVNVK
jgi:hypothetical protein